MKLYYHKTSGGAEYLFDTYIETPSGHKEGVINEKTQYVVRIDGDIEKDAELSVRKACDCNKNYGNKDLQGSHDIDCNSRK